MMGNVTTNQSGYLFQMDNNGAWAENLSLLDGVAGVGVALESICRVVMKTGMNV